jgi:hypothetical protein
MVRASTHLGGGTSEEMASTVKTVLDGKML